MNDKKLNIPIIPILAVAAALISAIFASYSGCEAGKANSYLQEINKAALSLLSTEIKYTRTVPETLSVDFTFNFKNTGNEHIFINNISSSYYNFKKKEFKAKSKNLQIINIIHPSVEFSHPFSINIQILKSQLTTEEIKKILPIEISFCIMLRIDYSSIYRSDYDIYYMKYTGESLIQYLSLRDYETMKDSLSDSFRFNINKENFEHIKQGNP